jgi:hypothetical protein
MERLKELIDLRQTIVESEDKEKRKEAIEGYDAIIVSAFDQLFEQQTGQI